jgi:hypothetical protein
MRSGEDEIPGAGAHTQGVGAAVGAEEEEGEEEGARALAGDGSSPVDRPSALPSPVSPVLSCRLIMISFVCSCLV